MWRKKKKKEFVYRNVSPGKSCKHSRYSFIYATNMLSCLQFTTNLHHTCFACDRSYCYKLTECSDDVLRVDQHCYDEAALLKCDAAP